MSKVDEALQRFHADRDVTSRVRRDQTIEILKQEIVDSRGLPPLQMEKEMGRLLQNVAGLLPNSQKAIIQLIGSRNNEGTSTILREFGLFLATKANKSVLLVDAGCAHLPQHHAFGLRPGISLQRIMSESGSVDGAISQVNTSRIFLSRLYEEARGQSRPDLAVNHHEIWTKLRNSFDFLLIGSLPMSVSDEAFTLCSSMDGVVLVVEAEKTRSQVVSILKNRVIQYGGNILGIVFNKQRHYIPEWIYKRL